MPDAKQILSLQYGFKEIDRWYRPDRNEAGGPLRLNEVKRQVATSQTSIVCRTIAFSYRPIRLLYQEHDAAFIALGDLDLVAGLANEIWDVDHRQRIGAQ